MDIDDGSDIIDYLESLIEAVRDKYKGIHKEAIIDALEDAANNIEMLCYDEEDAL